MSYQKQISRAEPGFIVMALDDSGSQSDCLPGTSDPKYAWVERDFGIILKELLARCTELQGDTAVVKSRYYTHTAVYGNHPMVWGESIMDIQQTVELYTKQGNSLGLGGNRGGTDTAAALQEVYETLQHAVIDERFMNSFPPMVFHLTDGMSQTDARPIVDQIKQLTTRDGAVLVVNAYIGTQTALRYSGPEDFQGYLDVSEVGPSKDNVRMFEMSSEMPDCIHQNLVADGIFPNLRPGARLFFDVRTKEMLKHVIQVVGSVGSRGDRLQR